MTTDVDILNQCLARIGASPIESRTDPAGVAAWACYDAIVSFVLGSYPWAFGRLTRQLTQAAAPADVPWTYAYRLPETITGEVTAVFIAPSDPRPFQDWEREGPNILTNAPQIWVRFQRLREPDEWPPAVAEVIRIGIMAELALAIREDGVLRDRLRLQAFGTPSEGGLGGLLALAQGRDAMGKPAPTIAAGRNPLIDCRR